ncbi:uncharacterized protein LOC141637208 isoform X2 [Silene latifolia]|uniref:uncharacterized protein LOC141637208 isoform X2 n=1 Tax=Silene latifolia TaxID=37657 RepID=UPI003D78AAE5
MVGSRLGETRSLMTCLVVVILKIGFVGRWMYFRFILRFRRLKKLKRMRMQSGELGVDDVKHKGRIIHYNIVQDDKNIEKVDEGLSLVFTGNGVTELCQCLEEVTGLSDIILCMRSPLNGKLYPMRLALPPNHVNLHIYVVPSSFQGEHE